MEKNRLVHAFENVRKNKTCSGGVTRCRCALCRKCVVFRVRVRLEPRRCTHIILKRFLNPLFVTNLLLEHYFDSSEEGRGTLTRFIYLFFYFEISHFTLRVRDFRRKTKTDNYYTRAKGTISVMI